MKVKELIILLQAEDQERLVVCQKDPEGNSYSPFSAVWSGAYAAQAPWYGEAGLDKLTEDDKRKGYTEEDVLKNGVLALFLVPTN